MGEEFLNATFQGLLKKNGIQFQDCRNPDVKCAVIERYNRTLKTRRYKYHTYKNTYCYIDVLDKIVVITIRYTRQRVLPLEELEKATYLPSGTG
jgi:hypothetical protein